MKRLFFVFSFFIFIFIKIGYTTNCYPDFCRNTTSFQLKPEEKCLLQPVQRGEECANMRFDSLGHSPPFGDSLTKVSLSAYVKDFGELKGKVTAFNFTVTDINFHRLITRYQNVGEYSNSACRQIEFNKNVTQYPLKVFFVSCPFSNSSFEAHPYRLEYLISSSNYEYSRKLVFTVPHHRFIDDNLSNISLYTPFIYIDVSDAATLTLYIQVVPEKFNVSGYKVWLTNNDTNHSTVITLNSEKGEKQIQKSFAVEDGIHYFKVAALHPQCGENGCMNTTSPLISIKQVSHRLLIMIISVVWIPPVIIYALYHSYKMYKKKEMLKRSERKPKCLLVYSPTHMSHVNTIIDLAQYLRSCNIIAMIDELDIPESSNKDPVLWCNEAFHSADVVIVAASPETDDIAPVVYRNMDLQALKLIKENYPLDNKRYYALQFPYCKNDDIPNEARHFKRFSMPDELNKLVKAIHEMDYAAPFFGVSDKDFNESIKLAKMQVVPVQKTKKVTKEKDELLLPELKENDIDLEIFSDKNVETKINELPNNSKVQKNYRTNIEELNLLGETNETDQLNFSPEIKTGFKIENLKL